MICKSNYHIWEVGPIDIAIYGGFIKTDLSLKQSDESVFEMHFHIAGTVYDVVFQGVVCFLK